LIYFAQLDTGAIKIGTTRDVEGRLSGLESHYGRPLALLATMRGGRATERKLQERFAHLRIGKTEQFRPGPDLLEFIGKPLLVSANPDAIEPVEPLSRMVTLHVSPEWKDWIDGLARHCRLDVAKVIDLAVVQFAKGEGYQHDAPER
jgi:hypothetical protein